jgi:conjugal transfer mating pair stabilization protein TraN
MSITNLDSLVKVHDGTGATVDAIQGGWEAVKGPVVDSAEVVSEAFSTAYDTVAGPGTPIGDLAQVVGDQISQMTEQLTQAISEAATYVAEALGVSGGSGAAAGEVGQELAEEGATDLATQILGEAGAAYLSAAMTVMSAVSAAYLALQLAFPCEEEELILASKRGMEACHYVGTYCSLEVPIGGIWGGMNYCMETKDTYCCYNSPLSRIIMQSLRPQLGGFGSAENPRCEGIPLNQLETVDWDQVDWQPFINLMASAGQIPDPDDLTLDHLTGSGHQIQLDGGNLDAKTAAEEQLSGTSADDVRLHWQSNEDYYVGQ